MKKVNIDSDWEFEKEGVKSVVSLPHTWNVTKKRILCQYARLNPYETLGYIRVDASGASSSRGRS